MSRGARALTLYGAILDRIYTARPDLQGMEKASLWSDPGRLRGIDRDKVAVVSIMREFNWRPSRNHFPEGLSSRMGSPTAAALESDRFWLFVLNNCTHNCLEDFARFMEGDVKPKELPFDISESDLNMLVDQARKHASAEWGTW